MILEHTNLDKSQYCISEITHLDVVVDGAESINHKNLESLLLESHRRP